MREVALAAIAAAVLLSTSPVLAASGDAAATKPAAAPVKPVIETLWGKKVTDNYRYMEALDAATLDWMKAEGHYTRSVLDSIKPLADLKTRVANFTASFGLLQNYASFGGRAFYEERAPGSDNFDLMVKDANGVRKIVDVAALRAAHGGKPFAINYILASPTAARLRRGFPRADRRTRRSPSMTQQAANRSQARSTARSSAPPPGPTIRRRCTSTG